jgi:hypothetical protein
MEKHSSCSYFIQEKHPALEEVFVLLQSEHGHVWEIFENVLERKQSWKKKS